MADAVRGFAGLALAAGRKREHSVSFGRMVIVCIKVGGGRTVGGRDGFRLSGRRSLGGNAGSIVLDGGRVDGVLSFEVAASKCGVEKI